MSHEGTARSTRSNDYLVHSPSTVIVKKKRLDLQCKTCSKCFSKPEHLKVDGRQLDWQELRLMLRNSGMSAYTVAQSLSRALMSARSSSIVRTRLHAT